VTWVRNYWDSIFHLYWAPEVLGLAPLKLMADELDSNFLKIRKSHITNGRRIRHRIKTWSEVYAKLNRDEKALNGFFDIMFSICPDYIINDWLCAPLSFVDSGRFKSFSLLEISDRFGWGEKNVMQPDGFFTSPRTIICAELKLNAATSLGQMLKYASLLALEERLTGRREHLGLLYIVPQPRLLRLNRLIETWGAGQSWSQIKEEPHAQELNSHVRQIIEADEEHYGDVVRRLRIAAISWSELHEKATGEIARLDPKERSQQTLYRLLEGFLEQLHIHRDVGIV
jgi:hypothetical protein